MTALEWPVLLIAVIIIGMLWMLPWRFRRTPRPPPGSRLPPMPPASSIIGHLELLDPRLYKKAMLLSKEYGPVFRLQLFSREVVIVNDHENLKAFATAKELLNRPQEMTRGSDYYNGVMTLNGELWSANRRFCMTMLRDLGFANCKMEEKMMTEFKLLKEKIDKTNGEPMPIGRYIPECLTCNIAAFFHGSCIPNNSTLRLQFKSLVSRLLKVFGVADILVFAPPFIQRLLRYVPYTSIGKGHALMEELDQFIIDEILTTPSTNIDDRKRNFVRRYIEKVEESKEDTNSKFKLSSELSDSCDSETYDTVDSPFLFDPPPRRPVAERQALALQYRDEGDENVCCRQVPAVRGLMNGLGSNCITHHTLFPLLCLVGDLLEINRRQLEFYNPTYLEHADRNRLGQRGQHRQCTNDGGRDGRRGLHSFAVRQSTMSHGQSQYWTKHINNATTRSDVLVLASEVGVASFHSGNRVGSSWEWR
ncbi:cytochrome P450 2G1 [Rhipicephalus sanguineus]|uniref:cytochrome P450 2G1 n=1 Tax=Rhipicephalus sanguineus TaxID=34632 RepID=UPI00189585C0|nr:cytochrome P450 2G1 [Rhipicephalus sanguineus]